MKMKFHDAERLRTIGWAALHAAGAAAYVLCIAGIFSTGFEPSNQVLGIAGFLLLFCLSAGVMASLVFGRPVMWYLDGRKKEAVVLAIYTLFFLFVATALILTAGALLWAV